MVLKKEIRVIFIVTYEKQLNVSTQINNIYIFVPKMVLDFHKFLYLLL